MTWVGLQCVIVVFPDHTHLLFKAGRKYLLHFVVQLVARPIIDLTSLDCSTGIVSLNLRPATFFHRDYSLPTAGSCWFKLGSCQLLTKAQEENMHTITDESLYLIETPFNTFANRADPERAALVRAA